MLVCRAQTATKRAQYIEIGELFASGQTLVSM
jgi:hypothetical protein